MADSLRCPPRPWQAPLPKFAVLDQTAALVAEEGMSGGAQIYRSFAEFYPFYLGEHSKRATRRLHFAGSSLGLLCLMVLVLSGNLWWLAAALVSGYAFAWFSHFVVEKNRPATFRQPLYSFMGDWKMFWQMLTGQIAF